MELMEEALEGNDLSENKELLVIKQVLKESLKVLVDDPNGTSYEDVKKYLEYRGKYIDAKGNILLSEAINHERGD